MLTKEEIEILEKLQGNEYTAEYFFIQLKKDPQYVEILSERVQAERKMIENKKTDENGIDISLEIIKTSEIALKSVLNYMSLTLIDMKYFDRSKAPDSFTYPNMEQIIDLLTEKFRMYFFPNEKRKDLSELNQFQIPIKGDQFYSFYSAAFTNEIAKFSEKRASIKAIEDYAVINADQGTLKIIDYSTLKGKKPNTLAKKLLDICTLKVSQTLVHGATFPNTRSASFTVEELAELTNQPLETDRQREKFIERIYSSLTQLKHLYWQQSNKKKIKKFSDFLYNEIVLVESTGKYNKNTFYLLFSESAARILAISPVCESFPTNLFKAESRYSNAYEIGRKLISHTNIYNNRIKGNNCTLSVKKIIENTSIPTFEEIIEIQKRRDWKEKIKKPLERDLNNLLAVGVLSRWEYRDPKGNTYTSEQANDLNAIEYQELMMDFSVCYSDEEQSKRLISEEKHINKAKNKKSDESNGQTI